MSRLPTPGSDNGQWGQILNDFLAVEHNSDGSLKKTAEIAGKYEKPNGGIPAGDLSTATQALLAKADDSVQSVNAVFPVSGNVTLDPNDIGAVSQAQLDAVEDLIPRKTVFDVRDYGAVFDGATDDYDAIQACITAAFTAQAASGRAVVVMPAGVTVLGKAGGGGLRIPPNASGLEIRGSGKGTTVIKLTKECLRAFDFWQVGSAPVFKNLRLSDFTVDAQNIGPGDVGPLTTLGAGYTIAGSGVWTTVNVGSNAGWASKGLAYCPPTNAGTAAGRNFLFRKTPSSTTSIDLLTFSSSATIISGDKVEGAVADHVIVGTMFRANNDAAWNQRYDNVIVEDIEAINIPTVTGNGLGAPKAHSNFRGAVWFQPVCDPANPPNTPMYATRIYIRRCEAWGGECGFAVGTYGSSPQAYSMFLDDIVFEDLKHSAMVAPGNNYTGENFIIGGTSYGYRCAVRRCWGEYSGDVGLELDNMLDAVVEDTVIEDAAGGNFYSTTYNAPCKTISGPPTAVISNSGSGIDSSSLTLNIDAMPASVAKTGYVMIDNELLYYVQTGATALAVTRGRASTTGASHSEGARVIFYEVHRQKFRYRRCISRHTRQGILTGTNYMPKGWYQFQGNRPQPPIALYDCEYENTMPGLGDTPTYGADAVSIAGECPTVYIDGFIINRHGINYTTLNGRSNALVDFYRANAGGEPVLLEFKNIKVRLTGTLAAGASNPTVRTFTFRSGSYVLDWDSITIDYYLINAQPGATVCFDTGTNASTINGLVRRARFRSRSGDAAPIFALIAPTSGATIQWLTFKDTDVRSMDYSANAGNSNYRPFYIDSTQLPYVTLIDTKHAVNTEASAYARTNKRQTRVSTNYTVLPTDEYVGITSTAAARTITLPAATHSTSSPGFKMMQGKRYTIKDESNGAATNNITITPNGAETIDGAATKVIVTNGGVLELEAVPAGWVVV